MMSAAHNRSVSALPLNADMNQCARDVCVPKADVDVTVLTVRAPASA